MADFGALRCLGWQRHLKLIPTNSKPTTNDAVSEHIGEGQALPQQGNVQNAVANAEKSTQDQSDLEAATVQNLSPKVAGMDVRKLTRAQKSKLVDQALKVSCKIARRCSQSARVFVT